MNKPIVVAAMYHFARLEDFTKLREPLLELMHKNDIKGTLLLALEGINGTVSGSRQAINYILEWLRADPRLAPMVHKESLHQEHPFHRAKVKLKKEIVTMGIEGMDPNLIKGTYVAPRDWNKLISDPDVVLVDTRNDYEVQIGSFVGARNPNTTTFREFPAYVARQLDPKKHKKVAMYCTGGIRCEKSVAYLRSQGFEDVFHLQGGILKYLEEVDQSESQWQGECFVFDKRVAVNHALEQGKYDQCFACRFPITEADKQSEHYVPGVSCPNCVDKQMDRARFAEREKQMRLAASRNEAHIGEQVADYAARHRAEKLRLKQAQTVD